MTRRRALIVAYNFPPNAAIGTMRTLRLVEQLAADGQAWDVTVLTATASSHLPYEPIDEALLERVPRNVRVATAPVCRPLDALSRLGRRAVPRRDEPLVPRPDDVVASQAAPATAGVVRRLIDSVDALASIPDSESGWIVPAVCRGLSVSLGRRPDVIYSTAPSWSAQVVGWMLARLLGCRWVADFRDPWARGPWREDRPPVTLAAWRTLERRVVERADLVVFNTRRAREEFAAFYGPDVERKLRVVPNGCDVQEFEALTARPGSTFVLLHAGTLYGGRNSDTLVHALASAIEKGAVARDAFRVRLVGASADCRMRVTAQRLGLEDVVECTPRVRRRDSLAQMASASALLLLQPGHALSVPAKTYEYLATGRPILALTDEGETAAVMRESGIGVIASADDVAAVEAGLIRVIAMAREGVAAPPRSSYDGAERARELAALLAAVTSRVDVVVPGRAIAPPSGNHHA